MRALTTSFWLPRGGNDAAEYEDAFQPRKDGRHSARRLRFAVADGASESMLSGRWADLLTRTWCKAQRGQTAEILADGMRQWDGELAAYLAARQTHNRPIQWFEEPGLARGAFATLLGVQFTTRRTSSGAWTATSLGDTCLFQVREDELVTSFPLKSSADFGSSPNLVPSRGEDPEVVAAHAEERDGEWRSGDLFVLATDALSAWFLSEVEAERRPWEQLLGFTSRGQAAFAEWANGLRTQGKLRNDDVTVVRIEVL
ncbi:MAG TPA: hypothetical protein VGO92_12475 [Acidimicrobiales bacterium]|nr:hypothetical protein [Acidimicrobiales bacterium]